jgi:2-isopropylmalate synthase
MTDTGPARPRRISIFDASLRDGEQAPGNAMSPADKTALALRAEALGVDIIEAGFPGSSPVDLEATRMIAKSLTTARFATFNRANREDVRLSMEAAGDAPRHQIQICGTGSDLHLEYKRGISRTEAIKEVDDSLRYAAELGATDISFGIEDASRGEHELIRALVETAIAAGATTIILADTSGCAVPDQFADLVGAVRSWIPDETVLSLHCHDDLGLSLANALAGIRAGADEIQATLSGIGERAGNTALEELAAVLTYRGEWLNATTSLRTEGLFAAYRHLAQVIGLPVERNKAIVGRNAFATAAGIHQAGILRNPITYEFMDPARFGRQREFLVGRHSGRTILRHMLDGLGVGPDEVLVERLYQQHIANRPDSDCENLDKLAARIERELARS